MPELSLKLQWLLETVLYICLVIGALLFVKQNVEEYLEGTLDLSEFYLLVVTREI